MVSLFTHLYIERDLSEYVLRYIVKLYLNVQRTWSSRTLFKKEIVQFTI